MSFYLSKRNNTYYFRIRIPKDLLPSFPSPQIKKSLKTKDHSSAKLLHSHLSDKVQKTFAMLRTGSLSESEIHQNISLAGLLFPDLETLSDFQISDITALRQGWLEEPM